MVVVTDKELQAIKARADAARAEDPLWGHLADEAVSQAQADFVFDALADVTALVAEVERLRGLISLLIPMGASLEMERAASDAGFELASDWMRAALGH